MDTPSASRPPLSKALDGAEFLRWYWLKEELIEFARLLGLRVSGGKQALSDRIAAHLDGHAFNEAPKVGVARSPQLSGALASATVIPRGQRCSQAVREWLSLQVGPSFHFDATMRNFFGAADGTQTLGDALAHWEATRGGGSRVIDAQFEYNRFTRAWFGSHPQGDRDALLEAWHEYRSQPIDLRGRA